MKVRLCCLFLLGCGGADVSIGDASDDGPANMLDTGAADGTMSPDTGMMAALMADIVILPVTPSPLDVIASKAALELIRDVVDQRLVEIIHPEEQQ